MLLFQISSPRQNVTVSRVMKSNKPGMVKIGWASDCSSVNTVQSSISALSRDAVQSPNASWQRMSHAPSGTAAARSNVATSAARPGVLSRRRHATTIASGMTNIAATFVYFVSIAIDAAAPAHAARRIDGRGERTQRTSR